MMPPKARESYLQLAKARACAYLDRDNMILAFCAIIEDLDYPDVDPRGGMRSALKIIQQHGGMATVEEMRRVIMELQ